MIKKTFEEISKNWKYTTPPIVTIKCLTYNQEKYISQALDSFLMQETDFPFEILVHDDASTDNTAQIIKEYETQFPKIIKPIYETENQFSKGTLANVVLPYITGKYIATCEGDDYWTDKEKLQRQITFLEQNQEYSLSTENSFIQYTYDNSTKLFSDKPSRDISRDELLNERQFGTASCVFKTDLYFKFVNTIKLRFDTITWAYLAENGKVNYNDTVSSCYRRGDGITEQNLEAWAYISEKINKSIYKNFNVSKTIKKHRNNTLAIDFIKAYKVSKKKKLLAKAFFVSPLLFLNKVVTFLFKKFKN